MKHMFFLIFWGFWGQKVEVLLKKYMFFFTVCLLCGLGIFRFHSSSSGHFFLCSLLFVCLVFLPECLAWQHVKMHPNITLLGWVHWVHYYAEAKPAKRSVVTLGTSEYVSGFAIGVWWLPWLLLINVAHFRCFWQRRPIWNDPFQGGKRYVRLCLTGYFPQWHAFDLVIARQWILPPWSHVTHVLLANRFHFVWPSASAHLEAQVQNCSTLTWGPAVCQTICWKLVTRLAANHMAKSIVVWLWNSVWSSHLGWDCGKPEHVATHLAVEGETVLTCI